jgi:hypothetical protein
MKRNKKYNREIPKETFMNRLKHIVLFITGTLLFASPPEWVDDPGGYAFVATLSAIFTPSLRIIPPDRVATNA